MHQVVPDDRLQETAFEMARRLAAGPRAALRHIKESLDRALSDDFFSALDHEAVLMVRTARTDDHREAVRAFIEKRPPVFGKGGG